MPKADDYSPAVERAHRLVLEAIKELDDAGAPADIAAHLDLATHRMLPFFDEQRIPKRTTSG
jgi:DNA-binding GntR family transcriptional regulator